MILELDHLRAIHSPACRFVDREALATEAEKGTMPKLRRNPKRQTRKGMLSACFARSLMSLPFMKHLLLLIAAKAWCGNVCRPDLYLKRVIFSVIDPSLGCLDIQLLPVILGMG